MIVLLDENKALHFSDECQFEFNSVYSANDYAVIKRYHQEYGNWVACAYICREAIVAVILKDADYVPTVAAALISKVGEGQ